MPVVLTTLLTIVSLVSGHEYYNGKCPDFSPMQSWDWSRFTGEWWVALKMNSRSSCIRYTYSGTNNGKRTVTEKKLLPVLGRFNVPSAVESEGTLSQSVSEPASRMEVEWNTGVVGQDHIMFSNMEYVIIDTDYVSRALVCSCQDLNLGFFAVNRRTCDFLVRPNTSIPFVLPTDYKAKLDRVSSDLALDMRRVRQDDCSDLESMSFNVGHWWSLARDYGQSIVSVAAGWI